MFAQLGSIKFDLPVYFNGLTGSQEARFEEFTVIKGKPKLQFRGESLKKQTLSLSFHNTFCDPKAELKKLEKALAKAEALAFIYGNGEYKGRYVVESFNSTSEQSDSKGNIISIKAEVTLKEYYEDPTAKKAKKSVKPIKKINKHLKKKKKILVKKPKFSAKTLKSQALKQSAKSKIAVSKLTAQDKKAIDTFLRKYSDKEFINTYITNQKMCKVR